MCFFLHFPRISSIHIFICKDVCLSRLSGSGSDSCTCSTFGVGNNFIQLLKSFTGGVSYVLDTHPCNMKTITEMYIKHHILLYEKLEIQQKIKTTVTKCFRLRIKSGLDKIRGGDKLGAVSATDDIWHICSCNLMQTVCPNRPRSTSTTQCIYLKVNVSFNIFINVSFNIFIYICMKSRSK